MYSNFFNFQECPTQIFWISIISGVQHYPVSLHIKLVFIRDAIQMSLVSQFTAKLNILDRNIKHEMLTSKSLCVLFLIPRLFSHKDILNLNTTYPLFSANYGERFRIMMNGHIFHILASYVFVI